MLADAVDWLPTPATLLLAVKAALLYVAPLSVTFTVGVALLIVNVVLAVPLV